MNVLKRGGGTGKTRLFLGAAAAAAIAMCGPAAAADHQPPRAVGEMPKEVRAFLDNYLKDSTAKWGPAQFKGRDCFDDSIQIKILNVRAIEVYGIISPLDAYPDSVPLRDIIKPSGHWNVVVMAHNKVLYTLTLINTDGKTKVRSAGLFTPSSCKDNILTRLSEAYPESAGINPVFVNVDYLSHRFEPDKGDQFFYFPQKGPRKIYFVGSGNTNAEKALRALFPGTLENLDDSQKLIRLLKKKAADKKRKEEDFRRRHGLEDEKKHKEYLDCLRNRPLEYGGPPDYYDDNWHVAKRCLEQLKTGIVIEVPPAPRSGSSGYYIGAGGYRSLGGTIDTAQDTNVLKMRRMLGTE
jgi:hypothetical protein